MEVHITLEHMFRSSQLTRSGIRNNKTLHNLTNTVCSYEPITKKLKNACKVSNNRKREPRRAENKTKIGVCDIPVYGWGGLKILVT